IFIMLCRLVVLCSVLSSVLCCDWLSHYNLRNESLRLVELMVITERLQSQLVFIRDSLSLISSLYQHDNVSSAAWSADKTETFRINIHRQTEELSHCVSTLKYFYTKHLPSLHRQTGKPGSVLRVETKAHLEHVELLAASIKASSSTTMGRSTASTSRSGNSH
uniref:Uncharacterized protein n=1 Tax=Acanthochromis polyacanthus TaxID=80966 RepID=A0A3Q1FKL7_9TELE